MNENDAFDIHRDVEEPEYHPQSHLKVDEMSAAKRVSRTIDPKRELYPFSIVWSPLGPLTWCFPMVGHMGICDSRGYIWDFAGPYTIGRDNMAFGNPTRYIKLDPALMKNRPSLIIRISHICKRHVFDQISFFLSNLEKRIVNIFCAKSVGHNSEMAFRNNIV